ncbi:iron-containing redox enzyme family protein [Yinghuangia seranimata]|uniref:iron-containing redox enzyme family protein n=1 Tax=Yinghuangia seranimata TaxID=408067 RepID=UPI00248CD140|nr:iron-containing redox enzyme family protein [Yinghuangia seranimata]MDI2132418.1 iron-containing redox enzyme family protein [Yinghuangia seranimata]
MAQGYETALADVAPVLKNLVVEHPFIQRIVRGELTEPVYAAYLRETFHLVGETPHFLAAAAARTEEEWLQDWFLDLAVDERHHDRLCVRDLRNLGYDPDSYLAGLPGLGTWTMVGQNHYLAAMSDTAGILGFAAATEGLGATLGPQVAAALQQYPFALKASAFLQVHAMEDQDHIARVKQAFDRLAESPERYALMTATWEYTLRAYGQLFTDALERGAP